MKKELLIKIGGLGLILGVFYFFPPTYTKVVELEKTVEEYREQVGYNYFNTVEILERNVEELSKIDFEKELTEKEVREAGLLLQEFSNTKNILFYSNGEKIQLTEWRDKMSEVEENYYQHIHMEKLTEREVEELKQGLEAIRFIARDFRDLRFVDDNNGYDLMHGQGSEMIERIKLRLSMEY